MLEQAEINENLLVSPVKEEEISIQKNKVPDN